MDFKAQLMDQMKQAMKARDSVRVGTLRYLLSELKNAEIDQGELTPEAVTKVITKQVKQMKDALKDFVAAGRDEIVAEESQKIAILEEFLPDQMSDEDLEVLVSEVVSGTDERNMGKLIGMVMSKVSGQADGGRVSAAVKKALS
ncbi:MAG: glutamyl-tRNA amidotransferase [Candidatus Pacebacteria bacterium CG_4_9_14_3_um_filter_40_12]|nr:GatB/YqeY domain-containing protein [Candidatus Paceibacterota bacterium]PIR64016.1 MAG: glutamyl-tRNA amidotransferase [Candidatus Pacebacteria bacterium CG10_big_fil_rev_8_21_14_0_10_40_26]PIZ79637.1 MAG: glutamyl-tRNA amidotransferase [Candidatus Pacebacteria bacterium CG_4_10_14_0_2_um_filter_40_20]PJA69090.1 MAG: glutamyl-tRNA amidotransferase [Candidatus Pacebacteria bacterium CG_4_9_14_3_um_filter_40_12]PJC41776.1 MAG: glutamyl-tRNA amidotransferase [Candidatus Pacebacteria bacterium 